MRPLATPDVTLTQVIAAVGTLIGVLAGAALLDSVWLKGICVAGAFAVVVAWLIADAIIRHGRATMAAAAIISEPPAK